MLDRLHRSHSRDDGLERLEPGDDAHSDNIFADASGRLVAPAVAAKRIQPLGYEIDTELMEHLDDESRVMIRTGALIGNGMLSERGVGDAD